MLRISMLSNSSKLKIELIHRGLTQADLARKLGISNQYMCDISKGRKRPAPIIARLVKEFKLPEALFGQRSKAA